VHRATSVGSLWETAGPPQVTLGDWQRHTLRNAFYLQLMPLRDQL
jgi:hypothetical protein